MSMRQFEELALAWLQAAGAMASLGTFKSINRRPWVRVGITAFTAVTQTIRERDKQIETRRALVELVNNKELRLDTWKSAAHAWVFGPSSPSHAFIKTWDQQHGMPELHHRIHTLYNSDAIFCKSLVVGASLGILPDLQTVIYVYGNRFLDWLKYGKWNVFFPSHYQISCCASAGHPLNNLYARLKGVEPVLDPANSIAIGVSQYMYGLLKKR